MDHRKIPADGVNPYAHHPGFGEESCELRLTVTPARGGSTSSHGFACRYTGGHCLPCERCPDRRKSSEFLDSTANWLTTSWRSNP